MPDIEDLISKVDKKQSSEASQKNLLKSLQTENTILKEKLEKYELKIKELEDKMDSMVDFPTDVLELRAIIGRQRGEISSYESQLSEKDFKITEISTELSVVKDRYEKALEKLKEQGELGVRLKEKDLEIGEIKAEYESKLALKDDEINALKVELKAREEGFEKVKADLEKAAVADMKGELIEKAEQIKTLQTELDRYKSSYEEFQEKVGELRKRFHMDKLADDLAEFDFKELEKELSLQLKEKDGIIEVNEGKIKKLLAQEEKYIKQIEDLQNQILEFKKKMSEMEEIRVNVEGIQKAEQKAREEKEKALILMQNMKKAMESDPTLRIFVIVDDTGTQSLDALAKAIGQSVANTRRMAMELERRGLVIIENEQVSVAK
ncbi:MAG: hypothetical protein ACTSRG_17385 [Candidatus Helarchaeota archaeon]